MGGDRNNNVDHKWFEGVTACKYTTTTTTVSVCPRCGSIKKSGKLSCCGRGGSWFKKCGGAGNAKLEHTWHEGIQACKARSQFKAVIAQELNGAPQKDTDSSQGAGNTNYKVVIAATKPPINNSTTTLDTTSIITSPDTVSITMSARALVTNTVTNTLITSSTQTSASTSITTQGCVNLLKIVVHIDLLFIVVFS